LTITIVLHFLNSEPVVGEMDKLPEPTDNLVVVHHPRMRDGKDVSYIDGNVSTVIWPIEHITFIEILSDKDEDKIIGFVRE